MAKSLTSRDLIKSILRRAMLPTDQNTFTDEEFLNMLNEEIQYFGVTHLMRTHEEYLVTYQDFDVESDKIRYAIPSRAIGNKLRDVAFVSIDAAFPDRPARVQELARVSLEDQSDFNSDHTTTHVDAFFIEGNDVVLLNQPASTDNKLRMYFYIKPNTLVLNDNAGVINAIDTVTGVVTLSNFPEIFATLPKMDFIQFNSPNQILDFDISPSAVDNVTKTITFTPTDLPSSLKVGDYVNVAGEGIVPQLPTELQPILAQRVAIAALEALGDTEGAQLAQRKLDMMEKASNDLIDNRVEGAPEKIRARYSPIRQTSAGGRRGNF